MSRRHIFNDDDVRALSLCLAHQLLYVYWIPRAHCYNNDFNTEMASL